MVESFTDAETLAGSGKPDRARRVVSSIEFPYNDLDDVVTLAKAVYQKAGGQCALDQLAPWLGHTTVDSGTFRLKVSAARMFGLAEVDRQRVMLTRLGEDAAHPDREQRARATAFLKVPLYGALYDKFRGRLLPPDVGLERVIQELGVAPKQADKARQAFQRSALQAGFFEHGRDRLIEPVGMGSRPTEEPTWERPTEEWRPPPAGAQGNSNGGGGGRGGLHPMIQGLIDELPPPKTPWPQAKRQQWLQAAGSIFGVLYGNEESS